MRPLARSVVVLLAIVGSATLALPASAHDQLTAPSLGISAAAAGADAAVREAWSTTQSVLAGIGAIVATFLASAWLALAGRRSRRVLVVLLVVVFGAFTFQVGVHSVHHFTQHEHDHCVLAAASSHTTALQVEAVAVPVPAPGRAEPVLAASGPLVARAFRPDDGRAPPAPFAA